MWVLCGCWVTVCLLWCCLLCCAAAVSLIRTAHFQNSAGQRPLDWCASQTPDCMVQVRIIMSMIEILFNMNTEQSVNAGHHPGLLERTGGKGPGLWQSFCVSLAFTGLPDVCWTRSEVDWFPTALEWRPVRSPSSTFVGCQERADLSRPFDWEKPEWILTES